MAGRKKKKKKQRNFLLLRLLAGKLASDLNWTWLHYYELIRKAETSFTVTKFSCV